MPIIFTDNQKCEKCSKVFEWNYFELKRQTIDSSQIKMESIPSNRTLAHNFQQIDIDAYYVKVNCPHCGFDNHFKFEI